MEPAKTYDKYLVSFSGGKDSIACLLHLLEQGVPKDRIEIWHMLVDGREGSKLMDWPITEAYCKAVAAHFDIPIYFAWKEGGFERELLRSNAPTSATHYELPTGAIATSGGQSNRLGTRLKFPQVSPDLSVRWCSAYLKIDVMCKAITGQDRFNEASTLIVTGERGEESKARANYAISEPDRTDSRSGKKARVVDHWRPVRDWKEAEIWAIMERWKIRPHPAYQMGFGRVSCATCIFGNKNQWASSARVAPDQVNRIAALEQSFGLTIKRKESVPDMVAQGVPYPAITPELSSISQMTTYPLPIIMDPWELPAGAFGDGCGPT